MTSGTSSFDVVLVGAGTVGTAVAHNLRDAGHRVVAVASRSRRSAEIAGDRLAAPVVEVDALPAADLVLIGSGDDAIASVAERISERVRPGAFVCHFAGSLGTSPLAAITRVGASACAVHPVQALPTFELAVERLPGSAWGVTCSDAETDAAISLMIRRDLLGTPVSIAEGDRTLWHVAAVMSANGVAALLGVAEEVLKQIGIEHPESVVGPLAAGAVQNAREAGGGAATLTGPVVRNDVATIERHLAALEDSPTYLRDAYLSVMRLVYDVALHAGRDVGDIGASLEDLVGPWK
ncbi:MAG TPA: DUF2520 domain-containing protein [Actinomycetota bacterium]|nr:DUF2520 domain-containing protein [Actinomycetota bacterium]